MVRSTKTLYKRISLQSSSLLNLTKNGKQWTSNFFAPKDI